MTRIRIAGVLAGVVALVASPVGPILADSPDPTLQCFEGPVPAVDTALSAAAQAEEGVVLVENRGQWPAEVRFRARVGGADLWITDRGIVFDFHGDLTVAGQGHVVALRFEGAQARHVRGIGRQAAYQNYLLGGDPTGWAAHVPLYDEVVLEDLYDGVDLGLSFDAGLPRLSLAMTTAADLARVRMRLEGADSVTAVPHGGLRMETPLGAVEQRDLTASQDGRALSGGLRLRPDGTGVFTASGADASRPLVLSHTLNAAFFGGTGYDVATAMTLGADGSTTLTGITSSSDFPTTHGAYDVDPNGSSDAFVMRLRADGTGAVYSTYLGGTDTDYGYDVAVDVDGSSVVVGHTSSADFPSTANGYDTTYNGTGDGFVSRLRPDGTGLSYSTFFGGARFESLASVAVGPAGAVTVGGRTNSTDLPTTPGAFDTHYEFCGDGFVTRFRADGASLAFSTYLGHESVEEIHGIAVGPDGSTYVVGLTWSSYFPTTPGAFDTTVSSYGGDGFVSRFRADGTGLIYSTILGGYDGGQVYTEYAHDVAVGRDGSATVVGVTSGLEFPTTPGAFDTTLNGQGDGFVTRLPADGTRLIWSTLLGGSGSDGVYALALDARGSVVIVGRTSSSDFPVTPGAYDTTSGGGGSDAVVAQLNPAGARLTYSTYLGGTGYDDADAVVIGPGRSVTVAGQTSSEGHGGFYLVRIDLGGVVPG